MLDYAKWPIIDGMGMEDMIDAMKTLGVCFDGVRTIDDMRDRERQH